MSSHNGSGNNTAAIHRGRDRAALNGSKLSSRRFYYALFRRAPPRLGASVCRDSLKTVWTPRSRAACGTVDCRSSVSDRAFVCPAGHSFDLARSGYVNLLQPQDRRSTEAGDSQSSLSHARAALEQAGIGRALIDAVIESIVALDLPAERSGRGPRFRLRRDAGPAVGTSCPLRHRHRPLGSGRRIRRTSLSRAHLGRRQCRSAPPASWTAASIVVLSIHGAGTRRMRARADDDRAAVRRAPSA